MTGPHADREATLDSIRRTYRSYREAGRDRLWDPTNPGYARMIRDRDHALVDLIRHSLPVGGSVLDLGCGQGHLADLVRGDVGDLSWTGVDLLPESIADARRLRPWATWIEGSADQLPVADRTFDIVVASTLFSSLPTSDLERAVAAEIARVMAPGGWLVWYDVRYNSPRNLAVHAMDRRRLASLFPGWYIGTRSMTLLPPVARRLGRWTGLAYRPLELIPTLRSHLVGRLQRPRSP
ncbi:MAG: class I SAM-dependent methyltransferase [Candidatus Limnocylindria bacterium]